MHKITEGLLTWPNWMLYVSVLPTQWDLVGLLLVNIKKPKTINVMLVDFPGVTFDFIKNIGLLYIWSF